ncbi:hypothetical protein KGY77_05805 [Candidatus Bipolaricaulota bacterium]|nr:hypothetical protein [Candidatus Bipolaricaulota bacterium]
MNLSDISSKTYVVLVLFVLLFAVLGVNSYAREQGILLRDGYLLNCEEHAYLYRSSQDYTAPPNKTCHNRYRGHFYYVAEIAGEPVTISEVVASVTGGSSGKEEMVEGFKLEVLPLVSFNKSSGSGGYFPTEESMKVILGLLTEGEAWQTLTTFKAPCSSEKSTEVRWEGEQIEVVAVRVEAPAEHFVDRSRIGPGKDGGNELKESGGWMKIMSAPGHADYVKN